MSLKKCSECGNQISSSSSRCPHCGARHVSSLTRILAWIIFALVALTALGLAWNYRVNKQAEMIYQSR